MKTHKMRLYQPIQTWSLSTTPPKKPRRSTQQKIKPLDIMLFFRQLATLMTAGVTLLQSCDILQQTQSKHALNSLIQSVKNTLNSGQTLGNALKQHPDCFDTLSCQLVAIGEQSGKLDLMLSRIAAHKEKAHLLKKKLRQALIYPVFVFITAMAIVMTLLFCVVPRFNDLFQHFHGQLPLLTRMVIQFSDFLRHDAALLLFAIVACLFIFRRYASAPLVKNKLDTFLLKIPLTGNLLQKIFFARFARTLATLFSAGISLTDALKMMADFAKNHIFVAGISHLKTEITKGQRLHHAMQTSQLFPPLMIQMVKVGEESGNTEQCLEKMAAFYEIETEEWINNFSQLLEPLIIIILGVLIGGLVIAMYLPIFKLGTIM